MIAFGITFFSRDMNNLLDDLSYNLGWRWFRVCTDFFKKLWQVLACIHLRNNFSEYLLFGICEELGLFLNLILDCIEIYN